MATYYVDFEGAAGTGDGSSFANRAVSIATIPATAGDTLRIKASPSATSLGNATWTSAKRDITGVAIASSTNATPIVVTTSTAHGLVTGDYVSLFTHSTNTNANGIWKVGATASATQLELLQMDGSNTVGNGVGGATGRVYKITNCIVKLASPATKNIALCGGQAEKPLWVASTNASSSRDTANYKEGYSSVLVNVTATFTTGKAAYYTLPTSLDLSSYEQVSFWVRQVNGTLLPTAGQVYLALCSDTIGNTVVNRINIPAILAVSVWNCVTVNLGANLGSSIQSVALYIDTDVGQQQFNIDNIIASKSALSNDSLTLNSLISKGTGSGEWFSIQSINHDAIMLANVNAYISTSTNIRGYYGVSETVTAYKREPIPLPTSTVIAVGGDTSAQITFSGGWNRTDMSTQTDYTWIDGISARALIYGITTSGVTYIDVERINATRYIEGYRGGSTGSRLGDVSFTGCGTGFNIQAGIEGYGDIYLNNNGTPFTISDLNTAVSLGRIKSMANCNSPLALNTICNMTIEALENVYNHGNQPVVFTTGSNNTIGKFVAADNNSNYAMTFTTGRNNVIGSGSTTGHTLGAFSITTGELFVNDFTVNETTDVVISSGSERMGVAYFNRLDNTDKNSWIYNWTNFGTINQQTSVVDAPATSAWRLIPAGLAQPSRPLKLKLGTVVVAAGSLVTVTARMQRDTTDVTMQLVCPAGQIEGVTSDVKSTLTAAADTWETVTITFTPTNAGAVDIYAYAFNGSDPTYVCNLTVTQA